MNSEMISGVINTLNEEDNIQECIQSLKPYVDEIVVCDMYSDDDTTRIAEELGAKVIYYDRVGYVEPARKFAIENAEYEWVLVLDADERMTQKLGEKLNELSKTGEYDVIVFSSLFWYFGDWIKNGGFFSCVWPRMFKKDFYLKTYSSEELQIHKNFSNLLDAENIIYLDKKYYIKHIAYITIEEYLNKTVCKYSCIESKHRAEKGEQNILFKLIYIPLKEFLKRYILKKGYKDGIRGFILVVMYCFHKFAIYANIWFLKEIKSDYE